MRKIVFYSWQSDLPAAINRSFIEDCIKKAIRQIGRDDSVKVEPVLDRDTMGLSGSPDISSSILAKISVSHVFLADVSIINKGADRPMPNPNVLMELGYAVAELGWDRIILVQNKNFGGPELLPFDLRGRRTMVYEAAEKSERTTARGSLQKGIEAALRSTLEVNSGDDVTNRSPVNLWWGRWSYEFAEVIIGTLFIREVGPQGFLFDLIVARGTHTGTVTAYARIISHDLGYCRLPNGSSGVEGELVFRRRMENGSRVIEIEETGGCSFYHGAGVSFNGKYIREREPWFNSGFMNETELARLYTLLGDHLDKMRRCTVALRERSNLDLDLRARVMSGGVPGQFTRKESIVMVNGAGEIWAAYLDAESIHYFTNVPACREVLPKTMIDWSKHFPDVPIFFCEPAIIVPTRLFAV